MRFAIGPPAGTKSSFRSSSRLGRRLSPDGEQLVFQAGCATAQSRPLAPSTYSSTDARPLGINCRSRLPSARLVSRRPIAGFLERQEGLQHLNLATNVVQTNCEGVGFLGGGTWGPNDLIAVTGAALAQRGIWSADARAGPLAEL